MSGVRGKREIVRLGLAVTLLAGYISVAQAADLEVKAARDYSNGIPAWGWIFYPSLVVGAVYDDNVYRSQINRVSSWGLRVTPSFTGELNDGIHRTTIYGIADGRFYANATQADAVDAHAGILHIYEAQRDLIFRFGGTYDRQADVFTNGLVTAAGNPLVTNNQINIFTGNASVQKDLTRQFFVVLGGTVSDTLYDNPLQKARNGAIYTATGRSGIWVTPYLNVFAEGSADLRRYEGSFFDSNGYRVIGGLGTGQVGLLKGEIYGGYQAENFEDAAIGNVSSGAFGAKLSYFPTRYWTIRGSVDQSIGVAAVATVASPVGTAMRVIHAVLESDYGLWRDWTLSARFGYDHADYINSPRVDNAWFAGGRVNYTVWSNLGVTLDYQYTQLHSNAPLASYERNMVTLGANYKY